MTRKKSRAEILHEQWLIMKEDEENYKKFIEDNDSEAFYELVKRLIEKLGYEESENE